MAPGDEWLGIDIQDQGWRINKLDDVLFYAGTQTHLQALVARDGRLLRLPLTLPPRSDETSAEPSQKVASNKTAASGLAVDTIGLVISDAARLARWLG